MDNIALVLQSFSQNLRFLSNLQALSPFNFNSGSGGQVDNAFTVGIAIPSPTGRRIVGSQSSPLFIATSTTPQAPTIFGSDFRTVAAPGFVAQSSPFSIFSYSYANVNPNSDLTFNVGVQISNTFGVYTKVDIELNLNGTKIFSSRCYPGIDDRMATSFTVSVPMTMAQSNLIQVLARLTPDSAQIKLNCPAGYISVMES